MSAAEPATAAVVRPASPRDAEACVAIYAPIVRDTAISFEAEPPTAEQMAERIRAANHDHPWLVCVSGGALLGYAYASAHRARAAYRWSVDVSVYGHPDARRRGVGRGLYEALLAILTLQGFHRVYAGITLPNPASVALHEGCGFTPLCVYRRVGFKCGAWQDVGWWERPLAEPTDPPREPRPFAALRGTPELEAALAGGASQVRSAP